MAKRRILREITGDEAKEIVRISRSRTEEYRLVERAQVIEAAYHGESGCAFSPGLFHWAKLAVGELDRSLQRIT